MGIFLNLEGTTNREIIEEKVVYRGNGISISTDSTSGRNGYYFKVYDNESFSKASKVARINLEKPEYEYHGGDKRIWDLSKSDKQLLINVLKSKSDDNNTVWNDVVSNCAEYEKSYKTNISNLEMPDYMKLEFNKSKGNKRK